MNKEKSIKISVIIPSYNVENYISECLYSVLNQSLEEIEIICIDDCSTDKTYEILEDYKNQYKDKIKILKNNKHFGGLSLGQNIGIDLAIGDYIYFLDSDDYIDKNYLYELYNTALKYNADMVSSLNIIYIDIDSQSDSELKRYPAQFFNLEKWKKDYPTTYLEGKSKVNIRNLCFDSKEHPNSNVWNKIVKRKFILENNIRFSELPYGTNDFEFFYKCMLCYPKTAYNHNAIYYHRMLPNGIFCSTRTKEYTIITIIERMNNLLNYCINKNIDDAEYLKHRLWYAINYRFKMIINKDAIYNHVHQYALSIELDKELSNNIIDYNEYLIIRAINNYPLYHTVMILQDRVNYLQDRVNYLQDRVNDLNNQLNLSLNRVKLFGIYKNRKYLRIVLFGIRLTFKLRGDK